jgi:hypothetical protein
MNKFRQFFELLEPKAVLSLKNIKEPPDFSKYDDNFWSIWKIKKTDTQGVNRIMKDYAMKTYEYPLAKEQFIHFAPKSVIPLILKDNELKGNNGGTFAISVSFGKYVPRVQYRVKGKGRAGSPRGFEKETELGAIIFKTDVYPVQAKLDEVVWNGNSIKIKEAKEINYRLAITILKKTPYSIFLNWNDEVEYI